ncbi:MAG: hypothetical protein KJ630_08135 [Proteobacteria bacterium]|nr:hypothetical protein [Pseudomonadota bacterium]
MNAANRLEMFLALNAEAFKRGLSDAGNGLRVMAGGAGTAFTKTREVLRDNLTEVKRYNSELSRQDSILGGLRGHLAAMASTMAASISILAGGNKLVAVTREFDKLSAGLITATGSAEGSKQAFAAIQDFATKTPYDLAQVTDSFVKLVNFGLNPSERAMTSFGNTSSALGKDLNQMIEAVADAATGEFERLKEFGIKSKGEGDKVSFTFRGVTETVGKNAAEIEGYLIKLGETNFGDAMANRMATLDGALSNLGDSWNTLFLTISQAGLGEVITEGVRLGISALEELTAMVASGELAGYLKASAGQWSGWGDDISASISQVGKLFDGEMEQIENRGSGTVDFLTDAFRQFPENVRAFIGLVTVSVAAEFDKVKADAIAFKDGIKALFTDATLAEVDAERDKKKKIIDQAREESNAAILKERDAALSSNKAQKDAAKELGAEYKKNQDLKKADKSDRLEKFKAPDQDKDIDEQEERKAYQKKQKELAEKKEKATPEYYNERRDYWAKLEKERPLTKEEVAARQAEIKDEKTTQTEKKRLELEESKRLKTEQAEAEKTAKAAADAKKQAARENAREAQAATKAADAAEERANIEIQANQDNSITEIKTPRRKRRSGGGRGGKVDPKASAHGGELSDQEWQSLSKEDRALLSKIATTPKTEYDYFSKKGPDRFRGVGDTSKFLATLARMLTDQQKTKDANQKLLDAPKQVGPKASDPAEIEARKKADAAEFDARQKAHAKDTADRKKANDERIADAKKGAADLAQAEVQAVEKTKSAWQLYADRIKSIYAEINGREESLAEKLSSFDKKGSEESQWRRKLKEAKEYEKAAKVAMAVGDSEKAKALADKASGLYEGLRGGAGNIGERAADRTAYSGVKSAGLLGIEIAKALQQATAKTAMSSMSGLDLFGDLSSRIRGQLAAVAGGAGTDKSAGKTGGQRVDKVHELKFQGGSLRGSESDVEALLNLLAQAGMNAA